MTIRPLPSGIMSAATSLLLPYCSGITPEKLVGAIKSFEETSKSVSPPGKTPLTKKEAAGLLNVSIQTVGCYIRNGSLKAGKLPGGRLVRIDADSVASLIDYKTAGTQTSTNNAEVAP